MTNAHTLWEVKEAVDGSGFFVVVRDWQGAPHYMMAKGNKVERFATREAAEQAAVKRLQPRGSF